MEKNLHAHPDPLQDRQHDEHGYTGKSRDRQEERRYADADSPPAYIDFARRMHGTLPLEGSGAARFVPAAPPAGARIEARRSAAVERALPLERGGSFYLKRCSPPVHPVFLPATPQSGPSVQALIAEERAQSRPYGGRAMLGWAEAPVSRSEAGARNSARCRKDGMSPSPPTG